MTSCRFPIRCRPPASNIRPLCIGRTFSDLWPACRGWDRRPSSGFTRSATPGIPECLDWSQPANPANFAQAAGIVDFRFRFSGILLSIVRQSLQYWRSFRRLARARRIQSMRRSQRRGRQSLKIRTRAISLAEIEIGGDLKVSGCVDLGAVARQSHSLAQAR
jgi:hypothetical protein